ncbi:MAG: 50S ribosomal protein L15 [Flavobacteriales bacterium TMED84]|nr:MAG: 50S ribosomal protein L15 [Flavobacteriales bacterium TMED84]|tara:strand:- start:4795 stop:5250 length:456 start_codon:yes stop_codon:yes gene_type:complete
MELHNLKPANGSIKNSKRIGRGEGSKKGGTATRGHKGAKSRSGYSKKSGFEGGQQPLQRRVPKFGFNNINRKEFKPVNIDTLQNLVNNKKIKKGKVDIQLMIENGLVQKKDLVKILGRGELSSKLEISAHAFSNSAKESIEKNGGKIIIIE